MLIISVFSYKLLVMLNINIPVIENVQLSLQI